MMKMMMIMVIIIVMMMMIVLTYSTVCSFETGKAVTFVTIDQVLTQATVQTWLRLAFVNICKDKSCAYFKHYVIDKQLGTVAHHSQSTNPEGK